MAMIVYSSISGLSLVANSTGQSNNSSLCDRLPVNIDTII